MFFIFSQRAKDDYHQLGKSLQKLADKQLSFLIKNLRHPSLRAKKYDEGLDVWQARINQDHRFYFRIGGDAYEILTIARHPK